jgi:hypothetical protein
MKKTIDDNALHSSQPKQNKIKYNSFINTNVPDSSSKYIGSSTKTPSFNYHNSHREEK